jgi:hypothetical protein
MAEHHVVIPAVGSCSDPTCPAIGEHGHAARHMTEAQAEAMTNPTPPTPALSPLEALAERLLGWPESDWHGLTLSSYEVRQLAHAALALAACVAALEFYGDPATWTMRAVGRMGTGATEQVQWGSRAYADHGGKASAALAAARAALGEEGRAGE